MAKKNNITTSQPVADCNQLSQETTNTDLQIISVESRILTIRGQQVILDRDLAEMYHVEVGYMNRQVKRNIKRFPDDFMFQLTKEEYDGLKCHFGISNLRGGDRRALPYAFTEQGVSMLSGLLRSNIAIEVKEFTKSHDRFLILDNQVYLIGASLKDLGKKWFAVSLMSETDPKMLLSRL